MWILKEQFEKENFYFVVECIDENECDYTLSLSGGESVIFDSTGFFSY